MRIVAGSYEMELGVGGSSDPGATIILVPGSVYEMTNIHAWHTVRPVDGSVMSLMVTGRPWSRPSWETFTDKQPVLGPLPPERQITIMNFFRNWRSPRYYR